MSEFLTHTLVYDDTARLAQFSPNISASFKSVYRGHFRAGRLGSGTRKGGDHIEQMLTALRARAPDGPRTEDDHAILAFTLGWTAHRAADRWFKPIYAELNSDYDEEVLPKPVPIRIYHDIILYQEIMDHGRADPEAPGLFDLYLEGHPGSGAVSCALSEELFAQHLQRSLLDLHSFTGAEVDFDVWLTKYFERLEPMYVDIHRYARYYHESDFDAVRRFVLDPNFYDRRDGLIAQARSVQRGKPQEEFDLAAAMKAARSDGSQYAKCLWLSLRFTEACVDYYEGRIDARTLDDIHNLRHPDVVLT